MISSIINKIKYRKERVGFVQKDGRTYVKYTKVLRFNASATVKYSVLISIIVGVLGLGIKFLMSDMSANAPTEETADSQ